MASYLVTGVAGFIAARVAELLLEDGHKVVGVDDMNEAYDVRMKEHRLQRLLTMPSFTFHHLDVSDRQAVSQLAMPRSPFEAVFNLAARAGVRASLENPWVYLNTNVIGTLNLLELCRQRGIPKFILASTSSVYGANAPLPTPEDADSSHPLQPYAASKKSAEALGYSYHFLYDLDITVFRYFTVYGPAGRPDMVMFRFTQWAAEGQPVRINGDGTQSRGFTYVDDIARGTILGLRNLGYEIINLGGHEIITINELLHMIEQRVGKKAEVVHFPRHPADAFTNWANVEKAKQLLGWVPQVSLEEGVTQMVDWYNAERSWASQIKTE
ncbi:MAG: NAD-dependent epimerase/dehydratase family protein [Chloroflexota bacterium]